MRRAALLVFPVAAVALLAWWAARDPEAGRRVVEARGTPAPVAAPGEAPERAPGRGAETVPAAAVRAARVVDARGEPWADVAVDLLAGFPITVRTFRNGLWPAREVWLCPVWRWATTDARGRAAFDEALPRGARALVFTRPDARVHLIAEPPAAVVRPAPKCRVTGLLRDHEGRALGSRAVEGRLGPREDWHTRITREPTLYVGPGGPIPIDPAAPYATESDADGRFELWLRPGASTIAFGGWGEWGAIEAHVSGEHFDLGAIRLPIDPRRPAEGPHALTVRVVDAAGRPRADVEVQLWDGVVGPASHSAWTDEGGVARFTGLAADEVIAWTVPIDAPHVVEPEQCSGKVRLPCDAPVVLRARRPEEYVTLRFERLRGYCLLLRGDRLHGGTTAGAAERVAVPPGPWHAIVVREGSVLEGDVELRGAEYALAPERLRARAEG